jgi:hypothetical protein
VFYSLHECIFIILSPRHLATSGVAWLNTQGVSGVLKITEPMQTLSWAITASKGATSWIHIDSNGTGTAIYEACGHKYWVLGKKKRSVSEFGKGDMRSAAAFKDWEPAGDGTDRFEWEGVLLEPGHWL